MTTSGGGGYLLHAIKVYVPSPVHITRLIAYDHRYDNPSAEPVVVHRHSKKAKRIAEPSQEQFEDSTAQTSQIETDVHHTNVRVDG